MKRQKVYKKPKALDNQGLSEVVPPGIEPGTQGFSELGYKQEMQYLQGFTRYFMVL